MYERPPEENPYRAAPPEYTQYPQSGYGPYQSSYETPSHMPPYAQQQQQYVSPPPYYAPQDYAQEPGSTAALLGFIFSLVGTLAVPVFLIPAVILSAVGLKSRSRHGLALAGLIISIVLLVIWTIFVIFIIIAIIGAASVPPPQ